MIAFPNCKVNLGLSVTGRRADGYHDIQTILYPIPWYDILEAVKSDASASFTSSGIPVSKPADNLVLRAYELLKKDFPAVAPLHVHLHKTIPAGAGLGGGSADAAFTLRLLNDLFALHLSDETLFSYALTLGSDCPFFLINKPCFAGGRGELLQEIPIDLSGYFIRLIYPGIQISTRGIFGKIVPCAPLFDLRKIADTALPDWKHTIVNVFEELIFSTHPAIAGIKRQMYSDGAIYASMTGTGSTVYGIYSSPLPDIGNLEAGYNERWIAL